MNSTPIIGQNAWYLYPSRPGSAELWTADLQNRKRIVVVCRHDSPPLPGRRAGPSGLGLRSVRRPPTPCLTRRQPPEESPGTARRMSPSERRGHARGPGRPVRRADLLNSVLRLRRLGRWNALPAAGPRLILPYPRCCQRVAPRESRRPFRRKRPIAEGRPDGQVGRTIASRVRPTLLRRVLVTRPPCHGSGLAGLDSGIYLGIALQWWS